MQAKYPFYRRRYSVSERGSDWPIVTQQMEELGLQYRSFDVSFRAMSCTPACRCLQQVLMLHFLLDQGKPGTSINPLFVGSDSRSKPLISKGS